MDDPPVRLAAMAGDEAALLELVEHPRRGAAVVIERAGDAAGGVGESVAQVEQREMLGQPDLLADDRAFGLRDRELARAVQQIAD